MARSVALLARLQLRRRYRALARLALVIGIVGGDLGVARGRFEPVVIRRLHAE